MRIHTQKGLSAAHSSEQAGIAPIAAIIIALLVIGGGGYGVKKAADAKQEKKAKQEQMENMEKEKEEKAKEDAAMLKPTTLQVALSEQSASGQSGHAVITELGTSTVKIVVNLTGKPSGIAQPAHIHLGSCPNPGAVKYPLTSVDKGASQTEIPNMTLEKLLSELPLAINIHKSAADPKTYVACGNIMKEEKMTEVKEDAPKTEVTAEMKKEVKVNYTAAEFAPKTITIKKGDTVLFENKTGKRASVASDEHPAHLLCPEFDQYKTAERGKDEFRFTFEKVGTWNYHDHLNPTMTGTVIVE